jgi:hypothetical protein
MKIGGRALALEMFIFQLILCLRHFSCYLHTSQCCFCNFTEAILVTRPARQSALSVICSNKNSGAMHMQSLIVKFLIVNWRLL